MATIIKLLPKQSYLPSPPVPIKDFEGTTPNEYNFDRWTAAVITFCIVLKSTAVTEEPAATYTNDSWHCMFTVAPRTLVIPTQDERPDDDVVVSQTLTYYRRIKCFNYSA